jgi:hypothetical protein
MGQLIFVAAVLGVLTCIERIRFSAGSSNAMRYQLRPMVSEQWRRSGSSSDWRDLQSDASGVRQLRNFKLQSENFAGRPCNSRIA